MFNILLTPEAENDLFDIHQFIVIHDSLGRADKLYDNLPKAILPLNHQPTRGHVPPELDRVDVLDFLEINYKPYRIIYQIIDNDIFVQAVLNGRRQIQEILQRRLLRP